MADDNPTPDTTTPISILKSTQMRAAIVLVVTGLLGIIRTAGWHPTILGWDLATIDADKIVDFILGFGLLIGGVFFARKRVEMGKDPAVNLPPIESPAKTVARLTR